MVSCKPDSHNSREMTTQHRSLHHISVATLELKMKLSPGSRDIFILDSTAHSSQTGCNVSMGRHFKSTQAMKHVQETRSKKSQLITDFKRSQHV